MTCHILPALILVGVANLTFVFFKNLNKKLEQEKIDEKNKDTYHSLIERTSK
jgi:hypothetical protein